MVGGTPAGSFGGGMLLGAGDGTPTGSGPGVSAGRGEWVGAGLGTGSLGQRRTDWGQLVPQSGILLGEPIDLSLECPLLVRHKPALIPIRTPLALAHRAGSAIKLEKAL
jgi:hypothetical protein